jgi:hypothetical protein
VRRREMKRVRRREMNGRKEGDEWERERQRGRGESGSEG